MSYNNYELKYKTPMNDLPEHGEVVTENLIMIIVLHQLLFLKKKMKQNNQKMLIIQLNHMIQIDITDIIVNNIKTKKKNVFLRKMKL